MVDGRDRGGGEEVLDGRRDEMGSMASTVVVFLHYLFCRGKRFHTET